ncbi:MAG TPA: hypothetical protein VEJ18_16825, partial [Planctomycetota bacterium]|nr:hypothetical protein [Planctomycetota bacterium]
MRTLKAGPLSLVLEDGGALRYVRLHGHEAVRRIYVAVRDRNWDTIPARLFNLSVRESGGDHFAVTFDAQCVQGDVDFAWRGTITGSPTGTLTFTMDGEARSTFLRNRIGICVLHPVRECAGAACTVETPEGGHKKGAFPKYIWPHQPFKDIRALWYAPAPGLSIKLAFAGDVFEMEDQRNWTDASFKTYSTPLELPFPVEVSRGTRIQQSVTLSIEENKAAPRPATSELTLTVQGVPSSFLPSVGLASAGSGFVLRPPELERLRVLRPAHLRADVDLSRPDWVDSLHRAEAEARGLATALELAVHLGGDAAEQLQSLKAALAAEKPPLARVLFFHGAEKSTSARTIHQAREVLGPVLGNVPLGAGTNAYFAELNRGEPPRTAGVVAWSVNPQVHDEDDATLVENLEAQGWTVQSARLFVPERPLAVTPITLRPRFNPNATSPTAPAPAVDPRQWTLF